jgi:hypothetical protein
MGECFNSEKKVEESSIIKKLKEKIRVQLEVRNSVLTHDTGVYTCSNRVSSSERKKATGICQHYTANKKSTRKT